MIAALIALLAVAAPDKPDQSAFGELWKGWELVKEKDGIRIYKREVKGSPLIDFGGETVVGAGIEQVCGVLEDLEKQPEWVDSLSEIVMLEKRSPREYTYFQRFSLPWPLSDRDFVVKHVLQVDGAKHLLTFHETSTTHAKRPPNDCCVRGDAELADVLMTPLGPGRTAVAAMARADLKGSVPSWFVNWVQEDFPLNTFVGYRKQLDKHLPVPPACKELFTSP